MNGQQLPRRWFWATTTGWCVGIPLVVVLALASDALGIEGRQTIVGLAMGAAVGWLQSGQLRNHLPTWRIWFWASTLGFALPFAAADLAGAVGLGGVYSLFLAAALGALLVGAWQARLLRPWRGAISGSGWVLVSLLGWTLGAAVAATADQAPRALGLSGLPGAGLYLLLAALGGPWLGLLTGLWLRQRRWAPAA